MRFADMKPGVTCWYAGNQATIIEVHPKNPDGGVLANCATIRMHTETADLRRVFPGWVRSEAQQQDSKDKQRQAINETKALQERLQENLPSLGLRKASSRDTYIATLGQADCIKILEHFGAILPKTEQLPESHIADPKQCKHKAVLLGRRVCRVIGDSRCSEWYFSREWDTSDPTTSFWIGEDALLQLGLELDSNPSLPGGASQSALAKFFG